MIKLRIYTTKNLSYINIMEIRRSVLGKLLGKLRRGKKTSIRRTREKAYMPMDGERNFRLGAYWNEQEEKFNDCKVYFNRESSIQFYDENDMMLLQLDPTDLSVIYAAYKQMIIESNTPLE